MYNCLNKMIPVVP